MGALTNVIRIILLILSLASFIPQYRRILSRGDCAGIIPNYVLFNLIAATEQFALGLHFIVDNSEVEDSIVRSPPMLGDWLNLAQFAIVWLCHLVLFGLYLYHPPSHPSTKRTMITIYIAFLLTSLAPVIFESTLPPSGTNPNHDRRWVSAVFSYTHCILVNPIVTAIAVAALFPQAHETWSRSDPGALSVRALAAQAIVFAVVAFCWPLRMTLPLGVSFITWYQLVGWAAVDNLVFAIVQAVLWWISRRTRLSGSIEGETTPLIT